MNQRLTAILPCNDLDAAQRFFERLGFKVDGGPDDYRMMSDGRGGDVHLQAAVDGWLVPGRNPFGLYLYREDVDQLAKAFAGEMIEPEGPTDKPGACTSSRSTGRTRHLSGSVGRRGSDLRWGDLHVGHG